MGVVLGLLLAIGLEAAIRAGEPTTTGTSGVDLLTVPLPDPDPSDFVTQVSHPWWPMAPGDTWEFSRGLRADAPRETWRVEEQREQVGGIEATRLSTGDQVLDLAQDVDGNVWLLGQRREVRGGEGPGDVWSIEDGTPAGLLLPAVPRRGDGYALSAPGGVVREHVATGSYGERPVEVPGAGERRTLEIEVVEAFDVPARGVGRTTLRLARGVGPVRVTSATDGILRLRTTSRAG